MATLPSFEAILLEVQQSLGGPPRQTDKKRKFATGEASLEAHLNMGREIVTEIFDALELDDPTRGSAARNFKAFADAYKRVELETWTLDADQSQVLWMLLGYFIIPGLARHVAWWTLDCRMDRNMPGGRFWYLPEPRDGEAGLYLPVPQVVDWLLDLLGMSLEKFATDYSGVAEDNRDGFKRTLYDWRSGKRTPEWSTIEEYFHDGAALKFNGAFSCSETWTPDEKFAAALDFVKRKELTAERLRQEIPMTADGLLEAVLEGQTNSDVQEHFVCLLAERYAQPSPRSIRQYLRVARTAQDGYVRLLKMLCPGVDRRCADPSKNKLLQLFSLYKFAYNLTIQAWQTRGADSEVAENAWFEEQLPPQLACGPLLSIIPSQAASNVLMPGQILTRYFAETPNGSELEPLLPVDEQSDRDILMRNIGRYKAIADEWTAAGELAERLKAGGPWAKLQAETRFRVVGHIASDDHLSDRITQAAIERLHQLAETPAEKIGAIVVELHYQLNGPGPRRTKDTKNRVDALLDEAETNPAYEIWAAVILQYKAKHLLAQNDFKGALEQCRAAYKACKERSFGRMQGEIARDCWALELATQKLIPQNHEPYFRAMLREDIFLVDRIPTIEDAARSNLAYFWDTLYKPYPGFEMQQPRSGKETREIDEAFLRFLIKGDRPGFEEWIGQNKKRLATPFPDVESNSVLMFLIKNRTNAAGYLSAYHPHLMNTWADYLELIVQNGPATQLNWPDLKAQTPLMLMAEAGNTRMVKLLLAKGADPDKRDYRGLTALHAAIKSRVSTCVDALLHYPCRTDLMTFDKRSPLHTAVWSGNVHAVHRLVAKAPGLVWQRDGHGMTPLELAECLIEEPEALHALANECRASGANCATKGQLDEIVGILECVPASG